MASSGFAQLPAGTTLTVKPFEFRANDADLKLMYDLIKLSPVGAAVWENTSTEQGETYLSNPARKLGMRHDWLSAAKEHWANKFDWRESEARINAYPNYTVNLNDEDGVPFTIHFIALFSKRDDAIPLAFYHGWPGSFLEFFGILDILMSRYTPETLPYHIIVPSLPGYAFSSGPPANVDFTIEKAAELLHRLILGLGFKSYLSQGGDIGSAVASQQAARFEECKSAHLNMFSLPEVVDRTKQDGFTALEQKAALRGKEFRDTGIAYAIEHGTRTATIGLALSASPVALLAWIGEKFLEWSDEDPPIDKILEDVSLYWLTNTMPRCIYPYRDMKRRTARIEKPFGFSFFPKEIMPTPRAWVEQAGNLQYYYSHESGGHFAALEKPDVLLADVEDWISKVWHE